MAASHTELLAGVIQLAHAAWLEAGFTDPYQYMPFANDIALPFTDCTFDGSHYDYQVGAA